MEKLNEMSKEELNDLRIKKSEFLVKNHVYHCHSYLIEDLLQKDIISYDDINNMYYDCEKEYKNFGYETAEDMENDGGDRKEIFEWWLVSDWMISILEKYEMPVISTDYGKWWGRCTTGQAIYMDSEILEIANKYITDYNIKNM